MSAQSFLSLVAEDLLEKFGKDLRHVTVVFPNKRAGLFLNQELARQSKEPVWAPKYSTMSDLFQRMTTLTKAESIETVCLLHQLYREILGEDTAETLDQFYGWGEMLLADFDDIDKHLANARNVFANIHDLQELSDNSYLTPEQEETLRNFFQHFDLDKSSVLRSRFLLLWQNMYALYFRLKEKLQERGTLYEGALFRHVIEQLSVPGCREEMLAQLPQQIVFAGFNILNDVEERLMLACKKECNALFYWDYDTYYTEKNDNEAGWFMRHNLEIFDCELPKEKFDNLSKLQDITFLSTSFDNAQARYATTWLRGKLNPNLRNNAVVLCDESQLLPLLHSIPHKGEPGHPEAINATMGFPLRDTPVYSFLLALTNLQTDGYDKARKQFRRSVLGIVQHHPYYPLVNAAVVEQYTQGDNVFLLQYLKANIQEIGKHFAQIEKPDLYQQLYIEAIFQTHRRLQQLLQLIQRKDIPADLEQITLRRLLRNMFAGVNIPFHGEPALGIQIMGVLETRCLDFSHMLILNLEEGKLPKTIKESSLIPASLREVFGLTTIRHKIAVYAYYFYRMIQRTRHLTCVYNESSSGASHHEISRFLRQLQAETNLPIRTMQLTAEPNIESQDAITVEKTPEVMDVLMSKYVVGHQDNTLNDVQTLSPTAINTYIDCPLQFYYQYIAKLKIHDDLEEPNLTPLLGTILHDTAELIYRQIMERSGSNRISKDDLNPFVMQPDIHIAPLLDILFDVHLFHPLPTEKERRERILTYVNTGEKPKNQYYGEQIIYYNVLLQYITSLLRYDHQHAPFTMLGMEVARTIALPLDCAGHSITVRTGGRVDRIDVMEGKCRIVDYKSGSGNKKSPANIEQIFTPSKDRNGYYLQTMLYALAQLLGQEPEHPVVPALFYVGKAYDAKQYNPTLTLGKTPIEDFTEHAEEFMDHLKTALSGLFDPAVPFVQTNQKETCAYCPYKMLCRIKD